MKYAYKQTPPHKKIAKVKTIIFPNFWANFVKIYAPAIATIWISKILIIRPDVCSLGLAHSISLTPKYDAM